MTFLLSAIFFVFGLIIGSFLNVVILRLNTDRTFGGRSGCMSCQHVLSWFELIPVFSFLGLGGRCRHCKAKISIQYPIVELISGIVFLSLFLKFQNVFSSDFPIFAIVFSYYAVMFSLLLIVAVYDLRHKIIPDILSLIFGALAFIGLFFLSPGLDSMVIYPHIPSGLDFLSGFIIALPFVFFWLISSGRWMGLGDGKLALGIGWMLGLAMSLSSLVLAFWFGAIVGIIMIVVSKYKQIERVHMKSEIPFAPFLVLGAFLALIFSLNFFGIGFW